MVFGVEDFHDLVRLLQERPEWRAELRRLVLTEELLAMPEQIALLRRETEQRFQALAVALEALTGRVDALATQMEALTSRVDTLTGRVDVLAAQMATLTARVDALVGQMEALTTQVSTLTSHVSDLRGESLERRYRTRVYAYFAPLLRRAHVLTPDETVSVLEEAIERGSLTREQAHETSQADLVVRGASPADGSTLYLVVEVSVGIGVKDVQHAVERAPLLQRTGVTARPVVAGEWTTPEAREAAQAYGVWQLTDGHAVAPAARPRA